MKYVKSDEVVTRRDVSKSIEKHNDFRSRRDTYNITYCEPALIVG